MLPWTVNDPATIPRLVAHPAIAGVITDDARGALRSRGAE
jgi:hypothetical protein